MRIPKQLVIAAAIVLGIAGSAFAREDYFGAQAANQAVAQSSEVSQPAAQPSAQAAQPSAQVMPCATGYMHTMAAGAPAKSQPAAESHSTKHVTQTQSEAPAPQNVIEYGGGE